MWAASSVLYSRTLVGLDLLPRALLGLDFLPRNEHTLDRRACDWPDPSSLGWPNLASAGQNWPTMALSSFAGQRFQRQSFSQWSFSESFRIGLFSQPVHQLVGQAHHGRLAASSIILLLFLFTIAEAVRTAPGLACGEHSPSFQKKYLNCCDSGCDHRIESLPLTDWSTHRH